MLDSRGLAWVKAPYIDYPIKGWVIHAARRNPGAFCQGNRVLLRVIDEFKATHVHAFNPLYVASFALALTVRKQPLIYRCGDNPIIHNTFYRFAWHFLLRRTAYFVADSNYVRSRLVASGAPIDRTTVIYAPAPNRVPTESTAIPAVALTKNTFRFVYIGQITPHKGVGILIEAFRELALSYKSAHLLIAGKITDWRGDNWARELRSRILADPVIATRVHFLGHVEDVHGLITDSHVNVIPTIGEEPYGLVAIEAKTAGRPSITFGSGGLRELVSDGIDGVIAAEKTSTSLATAMRRYLDHPELLAKHGEAAARSLYLLKIHLFPSLWRRVYDKV